MWYKFRPRTSVPQNLHADYTLCIVEGKICIKIWVGSHRIFAYIDGIYRDTVVGGLGTLTDNVTHREDLVLFGLCLLYFPKVYAFNAGQRHVVDQKHHATGPFFATHKITPGVNSSTLARNK